MGIILIMPKNIKTDSIASSHRIESVAATDSILLNHFAANNVYQSEGFS